jgi:DNA uptake protein ComE-like DNA-binding protein
MLIILIMVRFTAFRTDRVPPEDLPAMTEPSTGSQGSSADEVPHPVLFTFDPNTVTFNDLLRLGLTERQAGTLINYRSSGARFRRPEDLARVYGIDSSYAARLEPYVIIADDRFEMRTNGSATSSLKGGRERVSGSSSACGQEERNAVRNSQAPGPGAHDVISPGLLIDLNICSAVELERLPGIGPVLSGRIVRYRTLLGGFVSTGQLREVYGIDSAVVTLIAPMVTLTLDSVAPLILDSVSFGDLARHPYVGYETARLITSYRRLSETPLTLGSMVDAGILSPQQAERMAPYVRPSSGAAGSDYEFISSKVLK